MVLFKDIAKASTDLLKRDFPHDKPWDVEFKYRGKNPQIVNCASVIPATHAVDATTSVKYSVGDVSTEIKLAASGNSFFDVTYAGKYLKGLNLGTHLERKYGKSVSDVIELNAEYDNEWGHSRLQFNPITAAFVGSSLITFHNSANFKIGGELSGGADLSSLKYGLGVAYSKTIGNNQNGTVWTLGLRTAGDGDRGVGKLIGNVHSKSNSSTILGTEMAMEVQHSLVDGKTALQFGGLWYLTNTNDTYVKAKLSNDAKLAMAITHKFCPAFTATIGTQVDCLKTSDADSIQYGLKLNCSA